MIKLISNSLSETREIGKKLGKLAKPGMVFILRGDLGAGKTSLTQGIAQGLGVDRPVSSPTFTILKIYEGRLTLNHIDAYRLEGLHQDLGFEEQIDNDGLTVIEWPDFIIETIGDSYLEIDINLLDDKREISLKARGSLYEDLLEDYNA